MSNSFLVRASELSSHLAVLDLQPSASSIINGLVVLAGLCVGFLRNVNTQVLGQVFKMTSDTIVKTATCYRYPGAVRQSLMLHIMVNCHSTQITW